MAKKNDSKAGKEKKVPKLPESLQYPESEDIYNQGTRMPDLNPDDNSILQKENEPADTMNEKDFSEVYSGDDLDIPGAELDDAEEEIGEEDEENNYYSLGGDNHHSLEEPGNE